MMSTGRTRANWEFTTSIFLTTSGLKSILQSSALADTEREFGPAHPRTIAARRNLASWYESTGRLAKAISLYNRALVDSERTPGADDAEAQKLREIVAALKIKQQASTIARLGPSVLQGRSSGSLRVRLRLPQWPAHHQSSDDKL